MYLINHIFCKNTEERLPLSTNHKIRHLVCHATHKPSNSVGSASLRLSYRHKIILILNFSELAWLAKENDTCREWLSSGLMSEHPLRRAARAHRDRDRSPPPRSPIPFTHRNAAQECPECPDHGWRRGCPAARRRPGSAARAAWPSRSHRAHRDRGHRTSRW